MFDVGQEVVCVDDSEQYVDGVSKAIHKGQHYIISWVNNCEHPIHGKALCIRLEGISRRDEFLAALFELFGLSLQLDPEIVDMPFRATRFKPVEKKEIDISVFKEILNKIPETENV